MEGFTIKSRIKSLLRSPSIRLRKTRGGRESLCRKVSLEKVLGITAAGSSALTCDPCSGTVAYPAGCVVVLLNPVTNTQQHLINSSRKTITTLSFSSDGQYLVTGESGHLPAVRVWAVEDGVQVAELQEHKYCVACVTFSPNSKYIVSVGSQHDMSVNVWLWKKNTLVATNKVSSKVTAVGFSDDSSYFVTAGNRHVRFWYLEPSHTNKSTVPLMGRSGLLGELHNNFFCDVACGRGRTRDSTFCITSSGLLCAFNGRRVLEKWVDLQSSSARCLSVTEDLIFCAGANGTVRVFGASDFSFICTLPRPHHLGVKVAALNQPRTPGVRYPDSVAVTYDPVNCWLSCVYNDHSLYVWDTRDLQKVGRVYSALYHSACVWDLQMFPRDAEVSEVVSGSSGLFFSCSDDGTVRMWCLENSPNMSNSHLLSKDLHEVIYMNDNSAALMDIEGTAVSSSEKTEGPTSEGRTAIRTICVSPDGRHLASGDRSGTLRVHELTCMREILKAHMHQSEILSLEYCKPHTGLNLLATASRDRLVQVLDVDEDYSLVQTLEEHSSSVTAVRFAAAEGQLRLISCGADKSLYFHSVQRTLRGTEFHRTRHVVQKTTLCDMSVDPTGQYAAVGCQDRRIRVFSISSGKQKRSYKGSQTDGSLLKIETDPSGLYVAFSCSDKTISLLDLRTGRRVAAVFAHSEIITSLKFTDDCRRLLSTSGDSCIFVWRLAPELTINMRERLSELKHRQTDETAAYRRSSVIGCTLSSSVMSCYSESERDEDEEEDENMSDEEHEGFQEDLGSSADGSEGKSVTGSSAEPSLSEASRPRRRWACRTGSLELMVKSMLELRQLDCVSRAERQNTGSADHLRLQERGSGCRLQDWRKISDRPRSAWLAPASAPEPEGVVLYSEHGPSRTSLPGSSYRVQRPAAGTQSPSSGFSVGYGSGGSSPDQDREGQQIFTSETLQSSGFLETRCETEADGTQTRSEDIAARLHGRKSTCRTDALFVPKTVKTNNWGPSAAVKPTVPAARPLTECSEDQRETNPVERESLLPSTPQRGHPHPSWADGPPGLQKSASIQNLSSDTRKSLTPTRLRREVRSTLSRLNLEKIVSRSPHHSSSTSLSCPWESPNTKRISRARSYMSPTTSSKAKITRSVSIEDRLHLDASSCETLPSSSPSSPSRVSVPFPSPSTTIPAEPRHGPKALPSKAVKPRICQRRSSAFAAWPGRTSPTAARDDIVEDLHVDRSTDPESVGPAECCSSDSDPDPEAMKDQQYHETLSDVVQSKRPQVAVKAFCETADAPAGHEASVSVEVCRQAAAELCSSVQRTTQLYRALICSEGCVEQRQVLMKALLCVRSELDSVRGSGPVMMREGKTAVDLLEQYSDLLLQSVEKRLHHKP